jgi:hypothetical protein
MFTKAPTNQTAKSKYDQLIAQVGTYLRENTGKPIQARQPILVVQQDAEGVPFAALCAHFARGETPEDAVQNLIYQLVGGSSGAKENSEAAGNKSGAEP